MFLNFFFPEHIFDFSKKKDELVIKYLNTPLVRNDRTS